MTLVKDEKTHTMCDDKMCNISNSWVVDYEKAFQVIQSRYYNSSHLLPCSHFSSVCDLLILINPATACQDGICPGTMKWSYTHQHTGAINSTLVVNGEDYCTSVAVYGTDPNNAPGV